MSDKKLETIVSTDTMREERVPPGQRETHAWPVLHYGDVPKFDRARWDFRVFGEVEKPFKVNFDEFLALPRIQVKCDIHCVTTWSKLGMLWEGVPAKYVMERAGVKPSAKYVLAHCEQGFTANLPMENFVEPDVICALKADGQELSPDHGYPLRLLVPKLYFWKSAKWLRGLEFLTKDQAGFWEQNGYHMRGDPWTEERYRTY